MQILGAIRPEGHNAKPTSCGDHDSEKSLRQVRCAQDPFEESHTVATPVAPSTESIEG
jgi:hypothetical protein